MDAGHSLDGLPRQPLRKADGPVQHARRHVAHTHCPGQADLHSGKQTRVWERGRGGRTGVSRTRLLGGDRSVLQSEQGDIAQLGKHRDLCAHSQCGG